MLLALTTVALADGQMGVPLTAPTTQGQVDTPLQGQMNTNTPLATSSTTGGEAGQMGVPLTDVTLAFLQSLPVLF
jgi:hypothetical protein